MAFLIMDSLDRKKVAVITKYAVDTFSHTDWVALGQITGSLKRITDHPRLLRSLGFNDDDYPYCVAEVISAIFESDNSLIDEVVDHFDIDLWYQQKEPEKYQRVFSPATLRSADFWKDGYLRAFVSHLSSNRERMSALKSSLAHWGISAFIAHEDIKASREWRDEVEAGLETMDVLVAVVEPGFKESDWCAQEVGYALGRKVDIVPLRAGLDPFGFFGKYQGIQIKGKLPDQAANEIAQALLNKPHHRMRLLRCIAKAFASLPSKRKIELINALDSWSTATGEQLKELLEQAALSEFERKSLEGLIARVGAFTQPEPATQISDFDDIPF
ncbi:MAG: hypothetical protein ABS92_08400 [Thiobacillus sp. SCN 63-374]|nr:MAG: hypothetical protein ABS92_08400 [Thiobacillus sp. SCN 63-374]